MDMALACESCSWQTDRQTDMACFWSWLQCFCSLFCTHSNKHQPASLWIFFSSMLFPIRALHSQPLCLCERMREWEWVRVCAWLFPRWDGCQKASMNEKVSMSRWEQCSPVSISVCPIWVRTDSHMKMRERELWGLREEWEHRTQYTKQS